MIPKLRRRVLSFFHNSSPSDAINRAVSIPCLPSDTAYDVKCPVCGRGFLIVVEPADTADRGILRRMASAALAAQHNPQKARPDRRGHVGDRRCGMPDGREVQTERRGSCADRRQNPDDRRTAETGRRNSDADRRPAPVVVRRGSPAVHPRKLFHLQKPKAMPDA